MPATLTIDRKRLGVLALGLAIACTPVASAQFGLGGGFQDAFRPGFTKRDVQLAVDALKLDETQRFILTTLFDDYTEEFRTGVDGFRDSISNLRDEIDPVNPDPKQVMNVVFGAMDDWRMESKLLVDQFMIDLMGLLNEDQLEAWPGYQRRLYRVKYLVNGRLSAESLDLLNIVKNQDLAPVHAEAIGPVLLEYEVQLDEALHAREAFINESQTQLINAIQDDTPEIGVGVAERRVALRVAVREIQERYVNAVVEALPEVVGAELLAEVHEIAYPKIFRKADVERIFDAALRLEDLETEIISAIEILYAQYKAELAQINQRLMQLDHDFQPRDLKQKVVMATQRIRGQAPERIEDPLRDEFLKRRQMARGYIDQLRELLGPDVFATLPGSRRWSLPKELDKYDTIIGDGVGPSFIKRGGRRSPDAIKTGDKPG